MKSTSINMSTPTAPTITLTNDTDKTTVIEEPQEESPSPLPISPPQSMSLPHDDVTMLPHHSPIVSSDDKIDNESSTAFSRSHTLSPDSTITTLMQFLTDTADRLAEPFHVVTDSMRNVIILRDRMIHRLSTANELLTEEQCESLITSLQEFAVEATNLGLPLIPQEIIEGFLERTHPREVLTKVTVLNMLITAVARVTSVPVATQTNEEEIIIHPVGAPPTFTIQASTDVLNTPDSTDSDSTDTTGLPPNPFPQEFNLQNDENFNVQPPIIPSINRILEHYSIPTWEDTTTQRAYYHIWILLTSWTFVDNYLHLINRHVQVDLIIAVNNFINIT